MRFGDVIGQTIQFYCVFVEGDGSLLFSIDMKRKHTSGDIIEERETEEVELFGGNKVKRNEVISCYGGQRNLPSEIDGLGTFCRNA